MRDRNDIGDVGSSMQHYVWSPRGLRFNVQFRYPSNELFNVSSDLDAAPTFYRREGCDWILSSEIHLMGCSSPHKYIRHGSRVVSTPAFEWIAVFQYGWYESCDESWSSLLFGWIRASICRGGLVWTATLTTGSQRLQGSTRCCKLETESWSRVGVEKRMSLHAHCCTVQASLSFYPLGFTKPPCMISYPWSLCFFIM
jgi:hypothetical protein